MNHNFIIDSIIENNGIILGSYVREWIGNGNPTNYGWKDIDIKCPPSNIYKIKESIQQKYPNIRLDFTPSFIPKNSAVKYLYTCKFFKYDGRFKILDDLVSDGTNTSEWLEFTKDKIYYAFLNDNEFYKRDSYQELKLNSYGWKFAGLNKFLKN
jgi:hypothetical protein